MALGDQNFDNDPQKGSSDDLSYAKPVRRRRGQEVADEIAAFQQKQLRGSSSAATQGGLMMRLPVEKTCDLNQQQLTPTIKNRSSVPPTEMTV